MVKYQELFDAFHTQQTLSNTLVDNYNMLLSTKNELFGALLVESAVTLSLMENGLEHKRWQMLLNALSQTSTEAIHERAIVGLLLVALYYDKQIRQDNCYLDELQDALTQDPELSFTALCNIARTKQIEHMENFQEQMDHQLTNLFAKKPDPRELIDMLLSHHTDMVKMAEMNVDQTFSIFRPAYKMKFFTEHISHWFLPWQDSTLDDMQEQDRETMLQWLQLGSLCDSDKYALALMYPQIHKMVGDSFNQDKLAAMGILGNMEQALVTNQYVQQLYRFFRLSPFATLQPFAQVDTMKQCIVYRLVVVGAAAKNTIDTLLV